MAAGYKNSIKGFLNDPTNKIVGALSISHASRFYSLVNDAVKAWEAEIEILKSALQALDEKHTDSACYILIEYPIPRRGKYVDVVILYQGIIVVLEFKIGSDTFDLYAKAQVEDYALDLKDFHSQSNNKTIVPLLIATESDKCVIPEQTNTENVKPVYCCGTKYLSQTLKLVIERYKANVLIDADSWDNSNYHPTPTIIDAATALFAKHNVREIARSHAGATNLTKTSETALKIVADAKADCKKAICFITGVPGAGKTLAGLNIVHNPVFHEDDLGVFLSGNGPLVKVLREALARDKSERDNVPIGDSRRKVSTFVQNVHHFLDEYYGKLKTPNDHVVIFDEAQRAWDRHQSKKKFNRDLSEPEMMLQIMDRRSDWAVIIALIGGGQEINSGEAGLREWGRALLENYRHWKVHISPQLAYGDSSTAGQTLFENLPDKISILQSIDLHLDVPTRSFRAVRLAEFVECVLNEDADKAKVIFDEHMTNYPIVLTRDLEKAKKWLRARHRGLRRIGLIASSGERRIKPYGLIVTPGLDAADWFLNSAEDVRSSYYLEDPATEFSIQGLELDWCCLCWGADFRRASGKWQYWQFKGTRWQQVRDEMRKRFIVNKYRVLLTRAREGLIIWVPPGDKDDPTRDLEFYDCTKEYLLQCGIIDLDAP